MKNILIIVIFISTQFVDAQNISPEVEKHQFKFNLLTSPSFDFELGISKHSTIGIQLGTEIGGVEEEESDHIDLGLFAASRLYYRYYYNLERRAGKEKNTLNNSANYFGLTSMFVYGNPIIIKDKSDYFYDDDNYFQVGLVYGFQRSYWEKLSLRTEIGVGYGQSNSLNSGIRPILNFNLGWIII